MKKIKTTFEEVGLYGNLLDILGSKPTEIAGDVLLCKMDISELYAKFKEFKQSLVKQYAIKDSNGKVSFANQRVDFGENKADVDKVWETFLSKKCEIVITHTIPVSKLGGSLEKIGIAPNALEPLMGIFISKD